MQSFPHWSALAQGARPFFTLARAFRSIGSGTVAARHRATLTAFRELDARSPDCSPPAESLLDLKIALAREHMGSCDFCPHLCHVDRTRGATGYCGVGAESAVHFEGVLYAEEDEIVPSHEVFLSGCTMRCAFCYSHSHITRPMSGTVVSPGDLASAACRRREQGATNLNLVGGEPIVHIATILRALHALPEPIPVVWNSNMYATSAAMELLDGVVDLYLGDIHFGNDDCAFKMGRIRGYMAAITESFGHAVRSRSDVIIRHLVVPGHVDCCTRQALAWARSNFPSTPFHLMFQYRPDYRALGDPVIGRCLSQAEIRAAERLADESGVVRYRRPRDRSAAHATSDAQPDDASIGESIEIAVLPNGRVSFHRLDARLLPVAHSMGGPASPC